jgi:hypothetical protein
VPLEATHERQSNLRPGGGQPGEQGVVGHALGR